MYRNGEVRTVRGFLLPPSGSACGPVIVPVFKTGGWQAILSSVGSTPTRFRHLFSLIYIACALGSVLGART